MFLILGVLLLVALALMAVGLALFHGTGEAPLRFYAFDALLALLSLVNAAGVLSLGGTLVEGSFRRYSSGGELSVSFGILSLLLGMTGGAWLLRLRGRRILALSLLVASAVPTGAILALLLYLSFNPIDMR